MKLDCYVSQLLSVTFILLYSYLCYGVLLYLYLYHRCQYMIGFVTKTIAVLLATKKPICRPLTIESKQCNNPGVKWPFNSIGAAVALLVVQSPMKSAWRPAPGVHFCRIEDHRGADSHTIQVQIPCNWAPNYAKCAWRCGGIKLDWSIYIHRCTYRSDNSNSSLWIH